MEIAEIYAGLPGALLGWYETNKRDLPWRRDKEPYHIWLSEIMLQQTRVEAVKGYYCRFLDALPDIQALAEADDEVLHKLWEGLGYYSRVRNLKKAAQAVVENHGGVFPKKYEEVLALPGIGAYTAGAICSIAYDMPTPAVDGNVLRLLARLTDDATPVELPAFKRTVQEKLQKCYPAQAGVFTQALMELGATVCGPNRKPDCGNCPCKGFCLGFRRGTAEHLPVRQPKRRRRVEEKTVFILSCDGRYGLHKRENKGLLTGLWEFPNVSGKLETAGVLDAVERMGLKPREILRTVERKHIFTHVEWDMRGVCLETSDTNSAFAWMTAEQICTQAALPTAFRQFWEEIENV